jgi:cytochrome oxidase assembly protein ShyY1
VFPNPGDLALSLGRDVEAIVLLMDPGDEHGFLRHWVPEEMGPGKHFGYALQWFAMGAALAGLLIWNARKRGSGT